MMAEETPRLEKSSKARFPGSSPTRMDRLLEKEELQGLNDRLAVYIERVRHLEEDNSRLTAKLTTYEETELRQYEATKSMYEAKNYETKKLLDDAVEENRKLRSDNSRLAEDLEENRRRFMKETKEREKLEKTVNELYVVVTEKEKLMKENESLRKLNGELEAEIRRLEKLLNSTRSAAENAKLMQKKFEDEVDGLRDELKFSKDICDKQIVELQTKMVRRMEVSETDFKAQYDSTLKEKLQEIREEYELELEEIKKEMVESHKAEVDELKEQLQKGRQKYEDIVLSNQDLKASTETIKSTSALLESKNAALERRISDLEHMRIHDKEEHAKLIKLKDEDIRRLNEDYDDLLEEYNALAQIKITLDLEISNYKKLLEGEEERLRISPPKSSPSSERRSGKRVRTETTIKRITSSNSDGFIKVSEVDPDGKFIKIFNTSTMDEPLGGYSVQKKCGDAEPVSFKFNPRSILKGGAVVTIWSASSGVKHKPPHDLLMKDIDWVAGENTTTLIMNAEDKVIATFSEEHKTVEREAIPRQRRRRYEEAKNESCVIS